MRGRSALSLAFFLSGAAGLIFQLVWFHRAGLVFGSSLWAVTVVLSSFMGGLALGNGLAGAYGARVRRPLAVYALLEVVVAAAGMAATVVLPRLTTIVGPLTALAPEGALGVNLIRLLSAFLVLVVPATAMGATLPILVGALCNRGDRLGVVLGRLYGLNTIGAVAGVIVAEVVLITRVGVWGTACIAALLDLGAAGLALVAFRASREGGAQSHQSLSREQSPDVSAGSAFPVRGSTSNMLACAFLAGGTLLALEVVWFRFLSMYVLSTTLAASLMLAVVLAAIGLGGLVASRWLERRRAAADYIPAVAFVAGCSLAASYAGFQVLTSGTQVGEWARVLWFALALTFPTAFLSGVLFPLIGDALSREGSSETRAVASLALANTAGALCGPPLAAFVLLPRLGMERTCFAFVFVYGVIGLVAITSRPAAPIVRRWPSLGAAVALVLALVAFPFGAMEGRYFPRAAETYARDGSRIVATREGPSETIFIMQQAWLGKPVYSRLVTNGFSMSGTAVPAMRYMRYFAYWPMLLHQAPLERALVICYGVGVTAGAVASIPSLQSIDVAEISPDVVAMSDVIYPPAEHPLHDPRVRLHLEDGRYFLQTTTTRFDLITGEPPPPRTPGAANIYTREYFQLVHDRLAEGGMTTYWLPVARPDPGTDVDTIVRAFCDVFEDCSLWNGTPFDLMLVGTRHAAGPATEAAFSKPWQTPSVQAQLRQVGFEQPEQIGATFVGDAGFVRSLVAGTPPLTDDFPHRLIPVPGRPSLSDPRYVIDRSVVDRYQSVLDPARARQAFQSSSLIRRLWPASLIDRSLPFFDRQRVINRVLWEGGRPLRQIEDLHAVLTETSLRTLPLWILGSDEVKQRIAESTDDGSGSMEYARGLRALTGRDYASAASMFARAEQRGLHSPTVRPLLVYALCLAGRADEARAIAHGIDPRDEDQQHFLEWAGKKWGLR